jgi:hypothetical protein
VLLLQPDVYGIPFPQLYLQVLDWLGAFALLGFDLPHLFKLDCVFRTNYHDRLYSVAACSILVLGVLLSQLLVSSCGRWFAKRRAREAWQPSTLVRTRGFATSKTAQETTKKSKSVRAVLVLSYLVYPSSSSVFFQTFNCRPIDSIEYHTKDLSIECASDKHLRAELMATAMVWLFSFGLPLVYLSLLIPHRRELVSSSAQASITTNAGSAQQKPFEIMSFFYRDYKPRFYYWEVVEVVRKLLLTGVLVTFQKGTAIQTVAAMSIIMLHIVLLVHYKPYRRTKHNLIAIFCYVMMLFVFFAGLLLAMKVRGLDLFHLIAICYVMVLLLIAIFC